MKNLFFPNREVGLIQGMNLTLALLVVILYAIDPVSGVHMAVLVGTTIFATTLVPARLLGIAGLKPLETQLLQVARNGKWLGIWTCVWFMLYTALALPVYYGLVFHPLQLVQRETVLLSASLFIFVCLLAISNKWSYEHVKWWKQINMFIWLAVPLLFTHLLLVGNIWSEVGPFWVSYTLFGLVALAGVSGIFRAKRDYFAFWRLWIFVGGSLIAALVTLLYPVIL